MRITHNHPSSVNAQFTKHKSGVNIETRFSSVSYYDVWAKLALHRPIQGLGTVESMCTPYFRS